MGSMSLIALAVRICASSSTRIETCATPRSAPDSRAAITIREPLANRIERSSAEELIFAIRGAICARIAVIYEGRIMKVLNAAETDKQELGLLMAGIGAAEKSPADGEAEE
mgnify:CR=1 FL=1